MISVKVNKVGIVANEGENETLKYSAKSIPDLIRFLKSIDEETGKETVNISINGVLNHEAK